MSPSYFCRNLVYLLSESLFPQKSFLFLSKGFQKQPYNWVIRFTLVIHVIINNSVCVSKYAYAAVTILNVILKTYIFHLQVHVRDAAK